MVKRVQVPFMLRLPLAVYEWIERQAEAERRSRNSQIVVCLEAAMAAEQAARPEAGVTTAGQGLAA